jgi:tetratricopeptide (TPR) repeat protein
MGATFPKIHETSSSKEDTNKKTKFSVSNYAVSSETTKTSSRSIRSRIVENFIIIWLDSNIKESNKTTQNSINHLRRIINSIQIFTDSDQCINFISNITNEKAFLIISATFSQKLSSLFEDMIQIKSIYIFCHHQTKHEQWINNYRKIKGIFTKIEYICDGLKQDVRQCETDLTPISIVSNRSTTNFDELDQSFMYSQLLKEILLELEDDDKTKKEFVDFCREQYADNNDELKVIDEFDRDYNKSSSIWWYTRECFIYLMLNKALRTQDVEIIIRMGFFVRDLHQQIEQLYSQSSNLNSFIVYRGQGILNNEFEKMKKSKGCLLSFNIFLSTSTKKTVSMNFAHKAQNNSDLTAILFRMEIDPTISSTPFALLDKISYYSAAEKEILFSMHIVFRIGDIKQIENQLWQVDLRLTSDNDQQLTQLTKYMREKIRGGTGLHRMGALMHKMGEFNKAEEIYTLLLETTSDDVRELAFLHHQLGYIHDQKGDLSNALSHYKKSLNINLINMSSDDPFLSPTYSSIGIVLKKQGDLQGALEQFQHALNIDTHVLEPDQLQIATRHNNIGAVLKDQKKYTEALGSYQRALEIQRNQLPSRSPILATTYNNIGLVYSSMGDKSTAVSYYMNTLDIFQKSLTSNHPSLAIIHRNIARALEDLHRYKEAVEHAARALHISRHAFGPDHAEVKMNQDDLDRLQQRLISFSNKNNF